MTRAWHALFLLISLALVAPDDLWPLSLLQHFRDSFAILAGASAVYFLVRARKFMVGLAYLALAVYCGIPVVAAQFGRLGHRATDQQTVRIVFANLWRMNGSWREAEAVIKSIDPDVAFFTEFSSAHAISGREFFEGFASFELRPTDDYFGYAFASKAPWIRFGELELSPGHIPLPWIETRIGTMPVRLYGVHLNSPLYPTGRRLRKEQLQELQPVLKNGGSILVGDLNITPWHREFKEFCQITNLRDARAPWQLGGSWPRHLPGFRIPIDYVLVPASIDIKDFRTFTIPGSDHLGIVVDVVVGSNGASAE